MNKIFVLDTSVLVHDPQAYHHFDSDSTVIIPIIVLSELDNLKKQLNEAGKNARVATKLLDELSNSGNIGKGVVLNNNTILKIDTAHYDTLDKVYLVAESYIDNVIARGNVTQGDSQILACAYFHFKKDYSDDNKHFNDITVVSNDINLKVRAKTLGLKAQSYEYNNTTLDSLYTGVQEVICEEAGYELQQHNYINPNSFGLSLHPNECILFQNEQRDGIALGRQISSNKIKLLKKHLPWGISSRNKEQSFALDLIMDKNIDLVTLTGRAGTGKSLIVLATALDLVLNKKEYDKLIIYKPIQPVGNDIGYLPGTMEEKLSPWFQSIMDNFEFLFSSKGNNDWRKNLEMYQRKGLIEMEAITYIRGRSISNSIILVDECQNLNKEEVKTILTRAGEGSKIILIGDIEQIDNSSLDVINNGLTHVIEKFKFSELAGHITFIQGERSRLASKAAEIL